MFTGQPIPDTILEEVLQLAAYAPSHKLTQPWRFKIFTGEALKKLSDYLGTYYKINTSEEKFNEVKYRKTKAKPLQSSHVIVIIMQRDLLERIPEWEEIASVAMAVQNIWLGLTERGIGTYWSSPKSMTEGPDFLDLKEGEKCLGLMYLGMPKIHPITPPREHISTKIEWIRS
jgi:nitroreductase